MEVVGSGNVGQLYIPSSCGMQFVSAVSLHQDAIAPEDRTHLFMSIPVHFAWGPRSSRFLYLEAIISGLIFGVRLQRVNVTWRSIVGDEEGRTRNGRAPRYTHARPGLEPG